MFRYIAMVWNDAEQPAVEAAHGWIGKLLAQHGAEPWQASVRLPGLAVLHAGAVVGANEVRPLAGTGAVLGRLFARDTAGQSADASMSFDPAESRRVLDSGGSHLFERYWGRYVAVWREQGGAVCVLREPTNALPCFFTDVHGVRFFFSAIEDLLALGLGPFTPELALASAVVCYQRLEVEMTGLKEVMQLLGGQRARLTRSSAKGLEQRTEFLWNPLEIAARDPIEDAAQATSQLYLTTRDCVQAWIGGYRSIVHTLSGGLDSSIVLSCMRDAPRTPQITLVNYHSKGSNTDERAYARLSAARAGLELLERERDVSIRFDELLHTRPAPSPFNYRYYLENSRNEAQLAQERGATALFSGEGGDQLFYQARAVFAGGDYLVRRGALRGLGSGLFVAALDGARVDRVSVWRALRDALAQKFLGRRWHVREDVGRFKKLLTPEVLQQMRQDPRFLHPWFREGAPLLSRTPSGKLWQAYQLIFSPLEFYDPLVPELDRVMPLFSQPLLELCLRIPVDVLVTGGWERAIARRAFQHDIPREIAIRRSKGGLEEYVKERLQRNLPWVRELLLDGAMVRAGVVDRARLEEVLSGRPTRAGGGVTEMQELINVETWLSGWRDRQSPASSSASTTGSGAS